MSYGWNTKKEDNGTYTWTVTETIWHDDLQCAETQTLQAGVCRTRAQAMGRAKKWVVYYRRQAA